MRAGDAIAIIGLESFALPHVLVTNSGSLGHVSKESTRASFEQTSLFRQTKQMLIYSTHNSDSLEEMDGSEEKEGQILP